MVGLLRTRNRPNMVTNALQLFPLGGEIHLPILSVWSGLWFALTKKKKKKVAEMTLCKYQILGLNPCSLHFCPLGMLPGIPARWRRMEVSQQMVCRPTAWLWGRLSWNFQARYIMELKNAGTGENSKDRSKRAAQSNPLDQKN